MITGRNDKRFLAVFIVSMLFFAGCSSSSSTSMIENPYEKQDVSGVWYGWIGNAFTIGIITTDDNEHYSGRFIGQYNKSTAYTQFLTPDGSYFTQTPETAIFQGVLEEYTWNPSGSNYSTRLPLQTLSLVASADTKSVFGGPPFSAYTYADQPYIAEQLKSSILALYYNTTYDVSPNVNNISGNWNIENILTKGNTLVLTINANTADTKGTTISGSDGHGNQFKGQIKIHYNPLPHNIYDVSITMNDSINLTGLAAYVLERNTLGITLSKKTLAIGATSEDKAYSLSGLASQK
jgi:hypothetical protein